MRARSGREKGGKRRERERRDILRCAKAVSKALARPYVDFLRSSIEKPPGLRASQPTARLASRSTSCPRSPALTWPLVDEQQQAADNAERLEEVVAQEVARRVRGVHGPEVVDEELHCGRNRISHAPHPPQTRGPALTLNTLSSSTRKLALQRALKPTATMTHAPKPSTETSTRAMDQLPWMMKPMKRKMSSTRPAS